MFNLCRDGNSPWNPQYNISLMDDGKKEDCKICPVWRHTIGNICVTNLHHTNVIR